MSSTQEIQNTTIVKLAIFSVIAVASVIIELFYRDPLYKESLSAEKKWQNASGGSTKRFFSIITQIGGEYGMVLMVVIIVFCFPLSKSYLFCSTMLFGNFAVNVMKILISSPRPFWDDPTLFKDECDGGFGNPSGHSFMSTAAYLGFYQIIIETKRVRDKLWAKILLLAVVLFFIISIVISRVYLGVHSINQVIYGTNLGVVIYILLFHILQLQKVTGKKFFEIKRNLHHFIMSMTLFFICLSVLAISFIIVKKRNSDESYTGWIAEKEEWRNVLKTKCPKVHKYRTFENDGLFGALTIFALIGAYLGLTLASFLLSKRFPGKEEEIDNLFDDTTFLKRLGIIGILLCCFIPIALYLAIPGSIDNLPVIYIFKVSVSLFLALFLFYGVGVFVSIILGLGNRDIYTSLTIQNYIEEKAQGENDMEIIQVDPQDRKENNYTEV